MMKDTDVIIQIKGVEKRYTLGKIGATTLQHEIQSWWAKKTGREDPNRKLFQEERKDSFLALDQVDLTVRKGETVGIIGRNGAGKSTLLKLLSRITAPSKGKIDVYGRITSMLEIGTGFDGELTGRENIYLNGAILGMSRAEIDRKMEEIIEYSEIRDFIDTPVKRYSSGMYTKLGFAVAANLDSEIMIMDEVLAVGDLSFQNKCIARMKEAALNENKTVLYVSHNMNQIRALCSRCIVLESGRIVFDGPVEEAISSYLHQKKNDLVSFDYDSYQRPSWLQDRRMRLKKAFYLNGQEGVFAHPEKPQIALTWDAYQDLKQIGLRIELQSMSGQMLGTYVFYELADQRKGEEITVKVELDITSLKDATYHTIYCFFLCDEIGNNYNLDRVEGLSFTVTGSQREAELSWDFVNWGHLQLEGRKLDDE